MTYRYRVDNALWVPGNRNQNKAESGKFMANEFAPIELA